MSHAVIANQLSNDAETSSRQNSVINTNSLVDQLSAAVEQVNFFEILERIFENFLL